MRTKNGMRGGEEIQYSGLLSRWIHYEDQITAWSNSEHWERTLTGKRQKGQSKNEPTRRHGSDMDREWQRGASGQFERRQSTETNKTNFTSMTGGPTHPKEPHQTNPGTAS